MDFTERFRYERNMLRKLYDWIVALSARPSAPWALAAVAFAESSFFIIPPDVMLAPMALARPERAFRYAFICTIGSVAGGILGYAIGHLLFDSVGMWILDLYGYGAKVEVVGLEPLDVGAEPGDIHPSQVAKGCRWGKATVPAGSYLCGGFGGSHGSFGSCVRQGGAVNRHRRRR